MIDIIKNIIFKEGLYNYFLRKKIQFRAKLNEIPKLKKSKWHVIKYKNKQIEIYLDKEFGLISDYINHYGIYEKEIIEIIQENMPKEGVFFDIGGNIGQHTLVISNFCKKVYCFEPITRLQQRIEINISRNQYTNIELIKYALSNKVGESEIVILENHIGKSRLLEFNEQCKSYWESNNKNKVQTELIKTKLLDDFIHIERCDFIKMDVEGYEYFVFKGGMNFIKKFMPKMIVEFSNSSYENIEIGLSEKFYNLIQLLNYDIKSLKNNEWTEVHSFDQIRNIFQVNLFLIPKLTS